MVQVICEMLHKDKGDLRRVKISWKAGLPGGVLTDGNSESSVGEYRCLNFF